MQICFKCKKGMVIRTVHYTPEFEKRKAQLYQYWYCMKCDTRRYEDLLK